MKIEHFQVEDVGSGRALRAVARVIEGLRGVAGVVAVRSMGLMTVLYDERRTDPLTISDEIVRASLADGVEPGDAPEDDRRRPRGRAAHAVAGGYDAASTIR